MNIVLLKKELFEDERGYFGYFWKQDDCNITFVEDRIAKSKQGVIRGFHGDNKTWKLITCLHGKLKLVLWDIKERSRKTFILDEWTEYGVLIQPFTLVAYQCLSRTCLLSYKFSEPYNRENQFTVDFRDHDILWAGKTRESWNLPYIVSERDMNGTSLKQLETALSSGIPFVQI